MDKTVPRRPEHFKNKTGIDAVFRAPPIWALAYGTMIKAEEANMTWVLSIVALACLVFSAPGVADAKDKAQAAASQAQQSAATTPRRAMTLKSSFRGDARASLLPSAYRDSCPGQY